MNTSDFEELIRGLDGQTVEDVDRRAVAERHTWTDVATRAFWPVAITVVVGVQHPWLLREFGQVFGAVLIGLGIAVVGGSIYKVCRLLDHLGVLAVIAAVGVATAVSVAGANVVYERIAAPSAASNERARSEADAKLLRMIPLETCQRTEPQGFATASMLCVPDEIAHRVHYQLFPSETALEQTIRAKYREHSRGKNHRARCSSGYGQRVYVGSWYRGSAGNALGDLLCYGGRSSTWIEWTDRAKKVLVTTYRRDYGIDRLWSAFRSEIFAVK